MMGGRLGSYDNPDAQQRPLLRLTQTAAGVRSRHRLLLLLLPCLPLADRAHPLGAPPGQDRRAWVRAQVDAMLADPRLPNPQAGNIDDRWEWAAPLLLDPELPAFLRAWRDGELAGASDNESLPQPNLRRVRRRSARGQPPIARPAPSGSASAPSSRCASATSARTTATTSARTPSAPRSTARSAPSCSPARR